MAITDLLKRARSIRRFDQSRKIDRETLVSFIEAVRYTPSTSNLQALKFYISSDSETNGKIRANTAWARLLPDYNGPCEDENPTAYVVVCIDTEISSNIELFRKDVGIAAQTINLLAAEREIGCCMIGSFAPARLNCDLGLADSISPQLILALGYPAEQPCVIDADGDVKYFRDEKGRHYVPKRNTAELIL